MTSVSFLADLIVLIIPEITEGRTNKPRHSPPFPHRERFLLDAVIDPENTRLLASQTRHDPSQTDCVAHLVMSFQVCSPSTPLKDRVVTHVVRSGTSSLMPPMAMSEVYDAIFSLNIIRPEPKGKELQIVRLAQQRVSTRRDRDKDFLVISRSVLS